MTDDKKPPLSVVSNIGDAKKPDEKGGTWVTERILVEFRDGTVEEYTNLVGYLYSPMEGIAEIYTKTNCKTFFTGDMRSFDVQGYRESPVT